jgi:hypothetical protein
MRNWIWMLAIMAALTFSTALSAQVGSKEAEGEEKEGEAKEEEKTDYAALFKDAETVIEKITVSEDDIKSYLKHDASFTKAMKKDAKWNELKKKNLKEAHDHGVKSETYLAWAKENTVDAATWLTKAMRIMCITFPGLVDEQLEAIKTQRAELEKVKGEYSEEEVKAYSDMLDAQEKDMKAAKEGIAKLPKATDAEAKLIEANKEAIVAAMFSGDDDEEEGEGEDGDKGDDDMG